MAENINRERDVAEIVEQSKSNVPEGVVPDSVQVNAMTDEEKSLEARLERALTPEMRARVCEALKGC